MESSTDQAFHEFLALCEQVGPASCALAGHGPVEKRVETMLRGTICPSDRGPFDPGFGQPAASR